MNIDTIKQRQNYSLEIKERLSEIRIRQWVEHWRGKVFISFSGGKDSRVLLHMARKIYPHIQAVFVNTGLEYKEIKFFVKTIKNVEWLKPKYSFIEILKKWGYPVISKNISGAIYRYRLNPELNKWRLEKEKASGYISKKWRFLINAPFKICDYCCYHLKEAPLKRYSKMFNAFPMIGIMAEESNRRFMQYKKQGCNAFNLKSPVSWPLAFWNDKDIWEYIKKYNVSYSKIYDMGEKRTGCMFCLFGIHYDGEIDRFHRMKLNHKKEYRFCMDKLGYREVFKYLGLKHET